ncbi:MAG: 3-hydroxybutyryl-CoA dehydrogenase, partial [Mesorhizobium sp.]
MPRRSGNAPDGIGVMSKIETIGIVGAGQMGGGIAH